jgi:hypothetical protein
MGLRMTVNIIFDSRRPEKYVPLMETLKRQGIMDYQIWPALIYGTVIESINASHKMIVRDAKEKGLEMVAIWEEDCMIPAADGWKHFLDGLPPWKWDLYLGGTYGLDRPVTNPIRAINGFHCYLVHERFYDTFLALPDDKHIDTCMDGLGLYYVEYPFIALQRPGWSSNSKAFSDKNMELTDADVYGGLPK